jgi:hypothetical protein
MHFQSSYFKSKYFGNHYFIKKYIFTYISSGCFIITGDYIKNIDGHFVNVSSQCTKDDKLKLLDDYYQSLNKLKNVNTFISTNEFVDDSECGLTDEEIKKYKHYSDMIFKLNKLKKIMPVNK